MLALIYLCCYSEQGAKQTIKLLSIWDAIILIKDYDNQKCYHLIANDPIVYKSALVQEMTWCQTGDKPLTESVPTQFTDAYDKYNASGLVIPYSSIEDRRLNL